MPTFTYEALNAENKTIRGTVDSVDRNAVVGSLTKQGLKPLQVTLQTAPLSKGIPFLKPKIKITDLVIFTRQLSTMVSAGVPLLRALSTLESQADNKRMKQVLQSVIKDVQGGAALGDALGKFPDVFSDIYVNMVRAGEAAGIVDDILKRLALQVEKNSSMRKKIKSASTYPMVLLGLTTVAFFGLMIFVIPTIGKILKDLGGPDAELPAMTQAMIATSDFMVNNWIIVFGGIFGAIALFRRWAKTPAGKFTVHRFVLKIPVLKTLIMKIAVARFTRTFSALIGAGVSVVEALKVTSRALGNEVFQREVEQAAIEVVNGKQLSQAMDGSRLFPGIVPQMLAVGEETGQTDIVLVKVAEFYEEEVDATIDSLSSILEPVMIVIMGSMVGLIAYNVMGPISSLSQNIQ